MFIFDIAYLYIVGPFILLSLISSMLVKSAYNKWSKYGTSSGLTGAQTAETILKNAGITGVRIEMTSGWLSDHYDPSSKVLRLSPGVYNSTSVAAVGIAAHEAGHAIQHHQSYLFLGIRSLSVPMASIGSQLAFPAIVLGIFLQLTGLILLGVIAFSFIVLFQIITLPVEFNASSRAKEKLVSFGIINNEDELAGVRSVLNAAALTYVAAAATAIAQLLYFLLRAGLLGGRDD